MNETVPELLAKLKAKWPHLRYTQIMSNAVAKYGYYENNDLFYLEDDDLRRALLVELENSNRKDLGETL